jgi:hypothetical protein
LTGEGQGEGGEGKFYFLRDHQNSKIKMTYQNPNGFGHWTLRFIWALGLVIWNL